MHDCVILLSPELTQTTLFPSDYPVASIQQVSDWLILHAICIHSLILAQIGELVHLVIITGHIFSAISTHYVELLMYPKDIQPNNSTVHMGIAAPPVSSH